jgi:Cytochrome C oxidase, cbb3-type, subunit III
MKNNIKKCRWAVSSALFLTFTFSQTVAAQQPGEYRVVNGKVDNGTYIGWKLFHTTCFGCHGTDALGTDLAPNLLGRVQKMTPRAFVTKVLTSYRIVLPDTDASSPDSASSQDRTIDDILRRDRQSRVRIVMPAWGGDPNVTPHVLDLFAYLTARADGKLGIGKPALIKVQARNKQHKSKNSQ